MPPNPLGLRFDGRWKVISMYPDVCLTPMGSSMVPVPYQIVAEGDTSEQLASTVRIREQQVFTMASRLGKAMGDEAGTGGGVKSGTNTFVCEPIQNVPTVRANGQPVIRDGHLFWMNNQNTIGMCVFEPPQDAAQCVERSVKSKEDGERNGEADHDASSNSSGSDGTSSSGDGKSPSPNNSANELPLESLSDEKAFVASHPKTIFDQSGLRQGLTSSNCAENQPGSYACSHWHCSNNCKATRYGGESLGVGFAGQVVAGGFSYLGGVGVELSQTWECLMSGTEDQCKSAMQGSDLFRDNPRGIIIAMSSKYAGLSCEQACAEDMGGHMADDPDLSEGPGKSREFGPFHPTNPVNKAVHDAIDAVSRIDIPAPAFSPFP